MITQIKVLLLSGFMMLFAAFIVNQQIKSVDIMGIKVFNLGNKKILVNEIDDTHLLTDPDSIKKYMGSKEGIAFLIIDDSGKTAFDKVYANYYKFDNKTSFDDIIAVIADDSSTKIIDQRIENDHLFVLQKVENGFLDEPVFLASRFTKSFPYYLRIVGIWLGQDTMPSRIKRIMDSIEVRK